MRKTLPILILVIIALAIALYFGLTTNKSGTTVQSQTDYMIEDTASIGKIFIADRFQNTITLTRQPSGSWDVNGKFRAREDAIQTLLKTFKNVYIQRPVPKEAQGQVIKVMAGSSRKVEIYNRDGEWIKTWYVGHATMDKKGTYMILETPQGGRSQVPYVIDMRGFIGMLNTRFFTNEAEWRSTGILRYTNMGLNEVEVHYPGEENKSFRITYEGGNNITLYPYNSDQAIAPFDTSTVKDYLLNFKLASFENYKTGLSPAQEDSVRSLVPYQIIRVTDPRQTREIKLWAKNERGEKMNAQADTSDGLDRQRVYAACDNGELALAQRYAWDKFRAPLQAFLPKKDK